MTDSARDWVPESALVAPSVLSEIDAVVAAWSRQWFAHRAFERIRPAASRSVGKAVANQTDWRSFAPGIAIGWSIGVANGLACNALALGGLVLKTSEADDRLMRHYADRIVRELAQALAKLFGVAVGPSDKVADPADGIEFQLVSAGKWPGLSLKIAKEALAGLCKRRCAAFRPPPAAKIPLAEALAALSVDVEASLGHAQISARELQTIAPGDIIILETAATDPVLLQSTLTHAVLKELKLAREGDELQLTVR